MTKIQIRKVNGVPMGRPVNPFEEYTECCIAQDIEYDKNPEWLKFEQSVTEHEAPGFEEGEAEGTLVWQWKHPFCRDVKDWKDEANNDEFTTHEYSVANGYESRQIWRVVPTPEKVEVKEALISKEAVIKILEDARIRSIRNSNEFAETMLYDIIQEIEELPSPPTH